MKSAKETCHCAVCGNEFTQDFPLAQSREEYMECRRKLAGGYVVDSAGKARRKISCPNKTCQGRVSVTILDQES